MKTIAFILCFTFLFSSCDRLFKDDELLLSKTPYLGDELRIDGYYYYQKVEDEKYTLIVFLYKNGIIISTRAYPFLDVAVVETEMMKEYDEIVKDKTRWGIFAVDNNKIKYERWVSPTEGITVRKSTGYIENDTTFHITEHYFSYNQKIYYVNEVWHFKKFDNKPDSTNNFIK